MRPAKSERARDALRTRSGGLGAIERRVLIVSNGEREAEEIVAMLGEPARAAIDRLLRAGYLRVDDGRAARADGPAPTPSAPAAPPDASRRSLAATRLYLLDMLQLQRDPDAARIAQRLRAAREPEAIARDTAAALDHLGRVATPSYALRVETRFAEVAPDELRARVAQQRTGRTGVQAA